MGGDGPESDVDIVPTIPPSMGLVELAGLERALTEILARPVDLVPVDGLRSVVRDAVERTGVSLWPHVTRSALTISTWPSPRFVQPSDELLAAMELIEAGM